MKYTKIALLVVIPVLALLFLGTNLRLPAAHATVTKVLTITRTNCVTLTGNVDWNGDDFIDDSDGPIGFSVCSSLETESNFRTLTRVLGGDEDNPKPEDFAKIDLDAGQAHELDGIVFVVAFVGNDDSVGFYADSGIFPISGHSIALCSALPGANFAEADCDEKSSTVGDGVVVAQWVPSGAERGTGQFRVRQGGVEITADYQIVGEPDHISLKSIDTAVQTGAPVCELFTDVPGFLARTTEPETSVLVATVTDSDDTVITGALVAYTVDDTDKANVAIPAPLRAALTPSLDLQALGLGSPEVLCGTDDAGTVKITASITKGDDVLPNNLKLDPNAKVRHASIEVPVQSPPETMTLSAVPPNLVCDGTASSNVSAKLTDGDGEAVVNGNLVHFRVVALGSVNPIDGRTTDGAATTAVTPLSGAINGVLVRATWMRHMVDGSTPTPVPTPIRTATPAPPEVATATPAPTITPAPAGTAEPIDLEFVASDVEQTMLVNCDQSGAVPEGPAAGSPGAVISPPSTGDGGSQASSWWVAAPLGAVALLLAGSGLALRRRTR
jgi:hypothetical protein